MIKSGLIFGAVAFLLILGSSTLLTPLCAPCLGLFLGLAAGYVSGVFDKPADSRDAVRKGAGSGAIAGSLGLLGGIVGGVINAVLLNPSTFDAIFKNFGIQNVTMNQSTIWIGQVLGGFCIGLFDIAWMAVLGVAGGAIWYQVTGKNKGGTMPPQEQTLAGS